jgi:hypothetical protein
VKEVRSFKLLKLSFVAPGIQCNRKLVNICQKSDVVSKAEDGAPLLHAGYL